jgi:hypothetical protein
MPVGTGYAPGEGTGRRQARPHAYFTGENRPTKIVRQRFPVT